MPPETESLLIPDGWTYLSESHFTRALNGRRCMYRAGRGERCNPQWLSGFQSGVIFAPPREYNLPTTHRTDTRFWRAGQPSEIGIQGLQDWIIYLPDDLEEGEGVLHVDETGGNYLLQIMMPVSTPQEVICDGQDTLRNH